MSEYAAKVSTVIDGDLDAVWQALTDPEAIKKYFMGATVATDWKEGSPITWSGDWKGKPFQDKGEVLEVKPKQRLRYSHWSPLGGTDDAPENYHVVAVTLDDADGHGTKVELTQSNLIGGVTQADRDSRADFEKNWSTVLKGLKDEVES